MFTIKTRREAAEAGEKRYYTGRLCAKGHDCQRFTSTGGCVMCGREYVKGYNKRLTAQASNRALGVFSYPLHADDHAAALAYCQALDLARGVVPRVAHLPASPAPFDVVAARASAFNKARELVDIPNNDAPPVQSTTLAPAMADQLRALGVIK